MLRFQRGDALPAVGDVVLPHRLIRPDLGCLRLPFPQAGAESVRCDGTVLHLGVEQIDPLLHALLFPGQAVILAPGCQELVLQLPVLGGELVDLRQPHADLQGAALVCQCQVFPGLFRLFAQRFHPSLQFREDVPEPEHVLLGGIQTALSFAPAVAVFGDARCLLEDLPALGTAAGDDLRDASLSDDRIAVPSQAGIHEQLIDILETHRSAAQTVLTLT